MLVVAYVRQPGFRRRRRHGNRLLAFCAVVAAPVGLVDAALSVAAALASGRRLSRRRCRREPAAPGAGLRRGTWWDSGLPWPHPGFGFSFDPSARAALPTAALPRIRRPAAPAGLRELPMPELGEE
jgi:hypothetical protein